MERLLQYCVEGLGFTRVKQWIVDGNIRWCWVTLGGAALMLQEFSNKLQQTFASSSKLGEGFRSVSNVMMPWPFITSSEDAGSRPLSLKSAIRCGTPA